MAHETFIFQSVSPQTAKLVASFYTVLILTGTVAAVVLIGRALRQPVDWGSRVNMMENRPWTWVEGLGVAAIAGILISVTMGVAMLLNHPRESTLVILQSVLVDLTGILAIAVVVRRRGGGWANAFGMTANPLRHIKPGLSFYLAMMPLVLFASLVYQGILYSQGYTPGLQDIALLLSGDHPFWLRFYMAVLAMVIAPVFEECLFRGIMLPVMIRGLGMGAGIFATSFVFAAIHFHLPSLVPLIVVASGFSLAYLYSGSLWVPIIMHGTFNGINLALLLAMRH